MTRPHPDEFYKGHGIFVQEIGGQYSARVVPPESGKEAAVTWHPPILGASRDEAMQKAKRFVDSRIMG